jgi:hypothetical protein
MKTNKELKNDYKFYKSPKGVFQIRNKTNGKIFIGNSRDLKAIWNRQRTQLNFGNHPNQELQNDWNLLGEDSFAYEIIFEIKEVEGKEIDIPKELKILEQLYLEELQPFDDRGYNKMKKK